MDEKNVELTLDIYEVDNPKPVVKTLEDLIIIQADIVTAYELMSYKLGEMLTSYS